MWPIGRSQALIECKRGMRSEEEEESEREIKRERERHNTRYDRENTLCRERSEDSVRRRRHRSVETYRERDDRVFFWPACFGALLGSVLISTCMAYMMSKKSSTTATRFRDESIPETPSTHWKHRRRNANEEEEEEEEEEEGDSPNNLLHVGGCGGQILADIGREAPYSLEGPPVNHRAQTHTDIHTYRPFLESPPNTHFSGLWKEIRGPLICWGRENVGEGSDEREEKVRGGGGGGGTKNKGSD
ncbi:hypothetical protein EYF80_002125 [Liparis tanakae]|uniref:Transmembrane protein n=1 Tax=Liparis tanakae TaxID=230148 RepID=A0A4Z2JDQ9_9TELE|nr:hypothetical protein EYF80_002125 [Liparis tanakae]